MRRTHADDENVFDCGRRHEEQVDEVGGSSWTEGSAVRRKEKGNPLNPPRPAPFIILSPHPRLSSSVQRAATLVVRSGQEEDFLTARS